MSHTARRLPLPAPVSAQRCAGPRARERGFTLMEMMVVLGILLLLLGLSAGMYRQLSVSYQVPAAASQVSGILRAARNYSRKSGLPSRVLVEPDAGRVTAFGYKLVSAYHFEDFPELEGVDERVEVGAQVRGALNEVGEVYGEVYVSRGKVGAGLEFVDSGAAVVTPFKPFQHSPRGFSLEAWVMFDQPELSDKERDRARSGKHRGAWSDPRREQIYAVIGLRDSYEMGVLGDGAVYVEIGNPLDEDHYYLATTPGDALVAGRWTHLRCTYDGLELDVDVDGVSQNWYPDGFELIHHEDWPVLPEVPRPEVDAFLSISRPDRFFRGMIDEPKVRIALPPESYEVGDGVEILGRQQMIYFDTRGSLDPSHHVNAAVIRLVKATEVPDVTGTTAVVHEGGTEVAEDVDPLEAEAEAKMEDVLLAMARYLEEHTEEGKRGLLDTPTAAASADDDHDENQDGIDDRNQQMEVIIVDLTGTIRG